MDGEKDEGGVGLLHVNGITGVSMPIASKINTGSQLNYIDERRKAASRRRKQHDCRSLQVL